MDNHTTIATIKEKAIAFRDARNWRQFHDPKNLAAALAIECGELQEVFLWKTTDEVRKLLQSDIGDRKIQDEIADIFIFLLYLSDACKVDISTAVEKKILQNENKYPIEKSINSHKKYTELD